MKSSFLRLKATFCSAWVWEVIVLLRDQGMDEETNDVWGAKGKRSTKRRKIARRHCRCCCCFTDSLTTHTLGCGLTTRNNQRIFSALTQDSFVAFRVLYGSNRWQRLFACVFFFVLSCIWGMIEMSQKITCKYVSPWIMWWKFPFTVCFHKKYKRNKTSRLRRKVNSADWQVNDNKDKHWKSLATTTRNWIKLKIISCRLKCLEWWNSWNSFTFFLLCHCMREMKSLQWLVLNYSNMLAETSACLAWLAANFWLSVSFANSKNNKLNLKEQWAA